MVNQNSSENISEEGSGPPQHFPREFHSGGDLKSRSFWNWYRDFPGWLSRSILLQSIHLQIEIGFRESSSDRMLRWTRDGAGLPEIITT
jgi:hypothetical protein